MLLGHAYANGQLRLEGNLAILLNFSTLHNASFGKCVHEINNFHKNLDFLFQFVSNRPTGTHSDNPRIVLTILMLKTREAASRN